MSNSSTCVNGATTRPLQRPNYLSLLKVERNVGEAETGPSFRGKEILQLYLHLKLFPKSYSFATQNSGRVEHNSWKISGGIWLSEKTYIPISCPIEVREHETAADFFLNLGFLIIQGRSFKTKNVNSVRDISTASFWFNILFWRAFFQNKQFFNPISLFYFFIHPLPWDNRIHIVKSHL